jgi:hypothetical protein
MAEQILASHTPGPWTVEECWSQTCGAGHQIKECRGDEYSDEFAANARLIAAAPDLLEALRTIWKMIAKGQLKRDTSNDSEPDWALRQIPFVLALKQAQMAIAKAEGK